MRSTQAIIHLDNLENNFNIIKNESTGAAICAAVKADGYGHGAIEVAKTLQNLKCNYFGVATIYEGIELIDSGIKTPIILFSLPTPLEVKEIVKINIEPLVATKELILLFEKECINQNKSLNLHLKIDTGMGRIGCPPSEALKLAKIINDSKYLTLKGVCTHLAVSELEDQSFTNLQITSFEKVISELKNNGIYPQFLHAANSGALIMNKNSIFNLIRTGINLYGYPPTNKNEIALKFKPVLELKTKVVYLKKVPDGTSISYGRTYTTTKPTFIATIPIGYADGYPRALSNKGKVLINKKEFPIVGNICMDQLMVEVDSTVNLYDDVILISTEANELNANYLADLLKTISYEILTNIHRVKRIYKK